MKYYLLLKTVTYKIHAWHWLIRRYWKEVMAGKARESALLRYQLDEIHTALSQVLENELDTTKEKYRGYIHRIWMRRTAFRVGLGNGKTKTQKVKQTPTFQTSDYFSLIRPQAPYAVNHKHYTFPLLLPYILISDTCTSQQVGKRVKWQEMHPILKSHILGLISNFFSLHDIRE